MRDPNRSALSAHRMIDAESVKDVIFKTREEILGRSEVSLEAAHAAVKELIAEKLKYLVPMTIVFIVSYVGLTVFAGFAKGMLGMKIVGSVNLGFVLIALNYLLSWVIAMVYGAIAAGKFDPLAARAATEISRRGN
jgi:uncharacterized membrane protein (DUF485 family)